MNILSHIWKSLGNDVPLKGTSWQWIARFKRVDTSLEDEERPGQ